MNETEMMDKVRAAVVELPILSEKEGDIELAVSELSTAYIFGQAAGAARFKKGGTKKAERSLGALHKTLIKAVNQIQELRSEAHSVLDQEIAIAEAFKVKNESKGKFRRKDRVLPTLVIDDYMLAYANAVETARHKLFSAPQKKAGASTKELASAMTKVAAHVFENLTGLRPTISVRADKWGNPSEGKFKEFLEDLFSKLNIKAKAASQAGRLSKEKRSREKAH